LLFFVFVLWGLECGGRSGVEKRNGDFKCSIF
jgi:hypothetical protein